MPTILPAVPGAIVQISLHALAILAGVLALVGLARTTIGSNHALPDRTAMGYLAACWVILFNGIDIAARAYNLKTETPPKRPAPAYRIAQHVVAMGLTVGGGILMLVPGTSSRGEWGGWGAWTAMAFVCLLIAGGFHYVLFVWEIVDMVLCRLRAPSESETPKPTSSSDDNA